MDCASEGSCAEQANEATSVEQVNECTVLVHGGANGSRLSTERVDFIVMLSTVAEVLQDGRLVKLGLPKKKANRVITKEDLEELEALGVIFEFKTVGPILKYEYETKFDF